MNFKIYRILVFFCLCFFCLTCDTDPNIDKGLYENMSFVFVKGGTFTMGCPSEQGTDCESNETPAHQVTLSNYYLGKFEVTQALWEEVMDANPSYNIGSNLPVENISWDDIQSFINKLNILTGHTYRLPTEAEWEYAARGGNKSKGYKYSGSNFIDLFGWYIGNSSAKTHSIGTKQPNELGIYDMTGNLWEWCQDKYGEYTSGSQTNPTGTSTGYERVLRGGSWEVHEFQCYVYYRNHDYPNTDRDYYGFRLVRVQ
jgi:formylglycine-generating enzyme required for sulfatase activity